MNRTCGIKQNDLLSRPTTLKVVSSYGIHINICKNVINIYLLYKNIIFNNFFQFIPALSQRYRAIESVKNFCF